MQPVIVNGRDLYVKHHQGQTVITLSEIDQIHEKNGSARRNFNYHVDRFIEGVDFFTMKVSEYRKNFEPQFTGKRGNPNIEVVLLTESGYMLLAKTFNDDLAWDIQRALVQNYFKSKEKSADTFELFRTMIDIVESHDKVLRQHAAQIAALENNTANLELRIQAQKAISAPDLQDTDFFSANEVARSMNLFSARNKLPHSALINAIAFQAGVKPVREQPNQYARIIETVVNPETETTMQMIQYNTKGIEKIKTWVSSFGEYAFFQTFYSRDSKFGKKGDLKNQGFKVGKIKYYVE